MNDRNAVAPLAQPLDEREEALWMLQRLLPDKGVPNLGLTVELPADRDPDILRKAAQFVVARHPMLRSAVRLSEGRPVRVFRAPHEMAVSFDVRPCLPGALAGVQRELAGVPFDLEHDELIRFTLFELPERRQVLLVVVHHLVFDALSTPQLVHDLAVAYDSIADTGAPPRLPPAPLPREPQASEGSLSYWGGRIGALNPGDMRLDAAGEPSADSSFAGGRYGRTMAPQVAAAVRTLRAKTRVTDNVILLAGFLALLLRHGAGPGLVVGIALNSRPQDAPTAIGPYFSIVPLRVRASPADTFDDLVRRTFEEFMGALEHRDVPYEALLRRFPDTGRDWQAPLFRHMFNFWPVLGDVEAPGGWTGDVRQIDTGHSRYDLEFVLSSAGQEFDLQVAYRTDVHDAGFVRRIADRYAALLAGAAADPACQLGRLPMATEHDLAIGLANKTAIRWRGPSTVAGLIDAQLSVRPEATALIAAGQPVSYRQLGQLRQAVESRLIQAGVGPGDVVAVAAPRGVITAATVLAAWRAGAAYLPIDGGHPLDRIQSQLSDSGARVLVADDLMAERLDRQPQAVIRAGDLSLPGDGPLPECGRRAPLRPEPDPATIAYVIYTSGSTGRPKGVQVTHGNLLNVVSFFREILAVRPGQSMMWLTTFAFDISALELLLPLATGGTVVVADSKTQVSASALARLITESGVGIIQATPTTWRLIASRADLDLTGRWLLCGGEPLPEALAARLAATGGRLVNVYGPTETTIWSTAQLMTGQPAPDGGRLGRPCVGRPIANTSVAVLDSLGEHCPVDVLGQVVIGGAGVSVGYLHRSDLTAERFVRHGKLGRVYRTGDLGLWRPDGRLELRGRADRQVKIHGNRIELGEVEAALDQHPAVTASAVVVRGADDIAESLTAFVVPAGKPSGSDLTGSDLTGELWNFAAQRLPSYAVPNAIVVVGTLPAGPSGKIDYAELTARAAAHDGQATHCRDSAAPGRRDADGAGDQLTTWLTSLWREVLGRPDLHADSNFFLSGGQSLLAARATERIRARYEIDLPFLDIFRYPTPRQLSRRCQGASGSERR